MKTFTLVLFLLLTLAPNPIGSIRTTTTTTAVADTTFIRNTCNAVATYPTLCFASLSSYAALIQNSHTKLASSALSVALAGARNASSAMRAMSAKGGMSRQVAEAMGDCLETVGDSVEELRQSMVQMATMGGGGGSQQVRFEIDNMQTWVSAALTDDDTCMEGFDEGGKAMDGPVKREVRGHVLKVAQLTSNALAFINCLANGGGTTSSRP